MSLGVTFGVLLMLLIHRYFINSNSTSVESGHLAEYNPYRFENSSDNNSQILGFWSIHKLNPLSEPGKTYK